MVRLDVKSLFLGLVLTFLVLPGYASAAFTDCAISWDSFANNPGFIAAYTYEGTPIKDTESDGTGGDDSHGNANVPPAATDLASAVDTSNPGPETTPYFGYYNGGTIYDPDDPSTMEDDYLFFRMRLRGDPTAKASYDSYHWNILLDVDGDGYKEYWVDLEGSYQQSSNTDPDRLNILYDDSNRQDIPDPDVSRIDSFAALNTPTTTAACPTVGVSHTRAMAVSDLDPTDTSGDWVIEFQIPMTAFNDGQGNQVVYPDSPVAFVFSTGASNQDPLQKDWMMDLDYLSNADPITFGDIVYPNGKPVIEFMDAAMNFVDFYNTGGDIYVWVNDRSADTDSASVETITVTVTDPATGDDELVTLTETGASTGIFTNNLAGGDSLSSSTTSVIDDDNDVLTTVDGNRIYVSYTNSTGTTVTDEATMLGPCDVLIAFTRATGLETDNFLITADSATSDMLYVTVTHSDANVSASVREEIDVVLTDPNSSETETLTLRETGVNTGVFRNYDASATSDAGLPTEIVITPIDANDGLWEAIDAGQVTATYDYVCGGSNLSVSNTASLFNTASGGRVSFTNSAGTYNVDTYSTGDSIYVKVDDTTVGSTCHPTTGQVTVTVSSPTTGDSITLTLVETFSGSGVYINSSTVPTASTYDGSVDTSDNILEATDDEQLSVTYVDCDDGDNDSTNNTKSDLATYNAPSIVIQEVLFYPDSNTCQTEHIKLINNSGASVDVTGYVVSDGDGFSYTIPQYQGSDLILSPGETIFISLYPTTTSPAAFDDGGSPKNYYLFALTGADYPTAVLEDGGGSSGYDQVLLSDGGGSIVDYVSWSPVAETSLDFRGDDSTAVSAGIWVDDSFVNVSALTVGQSLVRTSPGYDTNSTSDWTIGAVSTSVCTVATTDVTIGRFESLMQDGDVVVQWETTSEHDTIGFHLERRDGRKYRRVNRELLPGLITSSIGGVYTLVDSGVSPGEPVTYRLVEVEGSGRQNIYGPYRVVAGDKESVSRVMSDSKWFDSKSVRRIELSGQDRFQRSHKQLSAIEVERLQHRLGAAEKLHKLVREKRARRTGEKIKIPVRKDGLYSLDAGKISDLLGITRKKAETLLRSHWFRLENQGEPIGYEVVSEGKSRRDSGQLKLLFYGMAADSFYTEENVYWLTVGRDRAKSKGGYGSSPLHKGKRPATPTPYFMGQVVAEVDKYPIPGFARHPDDDLWMWDYLFAGYPSLEEKSFVISLSGVANVVEDAALTLQLYGASSAVKTGEDHHVVVFVNGKFVGESRWKGVNPHQATFHVEQEHLVDGANEITLRAVKDDGVPYTTFFINNVSIRYAHLFQPKNDALVFTTGGNREITVQGFSESDILLFQAEGPASGPVPHRVQRNRGGDFALRFFPVSSEMGYFAATIKSALPASDAYISDSIDLRQQKGSEWLIVVPNELKETAQRLADYRESQGLTVLVVDIEDIYDSFSHGIKTPEALSDFIKFASDNWSIRPRYLVLAGEGSIDYRNVLGGNDSLIPVLIGADEMGIFPSDNSYGDVDGNGAPEIAVGRLPVMTNEEFQGVVDKIISYESLRGGKALVVSDNADKAGNFPLDSSQLELLIQSAYESQWIAIGEQTFGTVRRQLLDGINSGARLISYIGHGSSVQLGGEGILSKDDVPGLGNRFNPGFLSALTCYVNYFAHPGFDSLGESLVVSPSGGAAAVWSSSARSKNKVAFSLGQKFYEVLLSGQAERVGDGLVKAYQELAIVNDGRAETGMYNLLGDPAMKVQ